jgi:hypothetical protein
MNALLSWLSGNSFAIVSQVVRHDCCYLQVENATGSFVEVLLTPEQLSGEAADAIDTIMNQMNALRPVNLRPDS